MTSAANQAKKKVMDRRDMRMGRKKRPPRITKRAIGYFLGFLFILDIVGWTIATYVFDTCYGVLCLLQQ